MALKTFQNLTEERQKEILQVAFAEFALKGYDNSSLSSIVKKCGLAKGSFYRYFANKKELYIYLIEVATNQRLSNLEQIIADTSIDFYQLLKLNFLEKIQFDIDNPVIGGFLYKILLEKDNLEIAEVVASLKERIIEQTQMILKLPQYKLNIHEEDYHLVAYHIFQMQLWLYDYIALKFNINTNKNIQEAKPVLSIPAKEIEKLVDKSIALIKNGIE